MLLSKSQRGPGQNYEWRSDRELILEILVTLLRFRQTPLNRETLADDDTR